MALSVATSLNRFSCAIWALTLRELRMQYGGRTLGLFWAFVEPCSYLLVMNIVMVSLRGSVSPLSGSFVAFLATGLMNYNFFNSVERTVRNALRANRGLLAFPRVKALDVVLGRLIAEVFILAIVYTVIFAFFYFDGMIPAIEQPLEILPPLICMVLYGLGTGLINASIISYYRTWESIYYVIGRANFYTCGYFFVARELPSEVQHYLIFQPILHSSEWLRSAWFPDFESQFVVHAVPMWVAAVSLLLGLLLERVTRTRQLIRT